MATDAIAVFMRKTAKADEPFLLEASKTSPGGVDPLGLRQINFRLMDDVLPGLNNVARHIRPFVVVAWAWRRALKIAQGLGKRTVDQDELIDFVDRVEVLYVASQLLLDPRADLPGQEVLKPMLARPRLEFSGAAWKAQRDTRRYSTSLSAAINYGPGLRALGWLVPHEVYQRVMVPSAGAEPALVAFEARIKSMMGEKALSQFGPVTVPRSTVESWGELWALDAPSAKEKEVMQALLFGDSAPPERRNGLQLTLWAAKTVGVPETGLVRQKMASPGRIPSSLIPISEDWNRVQVRQLFRLALEAMLYWVEVQLVDGPQAIDSLVKSFLREAKTKSHVRTDTWLNSLQSSQEPPTAALARIEAALKEEGADLANAIAQGIAVALAGPSGRRDQSENHQRLPLVRARTEAQTLHQSPSADFIRHVLQSWVLAQHVLWSVGRGLADARSDGKTLLRLRVVLEEGGWTLTPGATVGSRPRATPDRLSTALSLAEECGLIQ